MSVVNVIGKLSVLEHYVTAVLWNNDVEHVNSLFICVDKIGKILFAQFAEEVFP